MKVYTNNDELRVPFGLKHGRLYRPQDTERGLACECVCPGCGSALIANQGVHKRAYFSHYQSRECSDGYESAVHLMAKQVIEDHGYIVIPEYRKTLRHQMPAGVVLTELVVVPSRRLEFADVRLEQWQAMERFRPDVVGVTKDGTEILIEVFVTNAVKDDKRERFSNKNLVELDLSLFPQDLVADEAMFTKEVLSGAGREWLSCQLYSEENKAAHHNLKNKVQRFIAENSTRVEQAKIAEEERRENIMAYLLGEVNTLSVRPVSRTYPSGIQSRGIDQDLGIVLRDLRAPRLSLVSQVINI